MNKEFNKTTEHQRDAHGHVDMHQTKEKKKNPVSQFLGYAAVTMALALTVTALMLHASMQNNAASRARIQELQQQVNEPAGFNQQIEFSNNSNQQQFQQDQEPNLPEPVEASPAVFTSTETKVEEPKVAEPDMQEAATMAFSWQPEVQPEPALPQPVETHSSFNYWGY